MLTVKAKELDPGDMLADTHEIIVDVLYSVHNSKPWQIELDSGDTKRFMDDSPVTVIRTNKGK